MMRPTRRVAGLLAALVALTVISAGCAPRTPGRPVAIPGQHTEDGWWATPSTSIIANPNPSSRTVTVVESIPGDVLFATGDATLTPAAAAILSVVARDITARAVGPASIVGHTDHFGTNNYRLGLARARAVGAFLTSHGVNPQLLGPPASAGAEEPLCPEIRADGSDDADCRARDRRVTIRYPITITKAAGP